MAKFIERKEYNNVITIKLVMPDACNARCSFCYNRDKNYIKSRKDFFNNFINSIDDLIKKIGKKNEISLDITGGEPTLNEPLLVEVLNKLKEYKIKDKVLRVTLTTNGSYLNKVIPYMKGVVSYVNISVHDFRQSERDSIFNFRINKKIEYDILTKRLRDIGITCSACAVVYKEINDFPKWRDNFISWAKQNGFIAIRFRCDVFWGNKNIFDRYMMESKLEEQFQTITYENTPDSHWCRLRRKMDGFRVFFLHGVLDTSAVTKGIEYVIDTDGLCYCDYHKQTKISDYKYEIGKIYDLLPGDANE